MYLCSDTALKNIHWCQFHSCDQENQKGNHKYIQTGYTGICLHSGMAERHKDHQVPHKMDLKEINIKNYRVLEWCLTCSLTLLFYYVVFPYYFSSFFFFFLFCWGIERLLLVLFFLNFFYTVKLQLLTGTSVSYHHVKNKEHILVCFVCFGELTW